ncbi:MAG: ABC transporter permease [Chloracidobacterium sp.]|nr:ABC transporter permease [Chloracidobacterium sp.]
MEWFNILMARLRSLFRRDSVLRDIEEELRVHVEMETETNIKRGMPLDEARARALKSFGNVSRKTELVYDIRGGGWFETFCQDLRYGARTLLKNPGFSLVTILLTLALGIGANAAIFNFVNALLLRSIAGVAEPERLAQIYRTFNGGSFGWSFSYADFADYRDQNTTLAGLALHRTRPIHLSAGGVDDAAERVRGSMVSGNYFSVLGVKARLGRTLAPQDGESPGGGPVAVISSGLWRRRFGADPNIVGRTILLNARNYTVIGVAAEGFVGANVGEVVEVWVPITMYKQFDPWMASLGVDWLKDRSSTWVEALARLKRGVTIAQAQADLSAIAARLAQTYPKTNAGMGVRLTADVGLFPGARDSLRRFAGLLMGVAGIVLLIACANVANLLLARATARRKEISIRLALGAGRARILRQLFTESLLLALSGGLAGALLAFWLSDSLRALLPEQYSAIPLQIDLKPDARTLGFTLAASLLTGILFGLAPALQASKFDLAPMLKEGGAAGQSGGSAQLRGLLVSAQIALSLTLLVGAGLCVRTLRNLRDFNHGLETDRVLTANLDPGRQNYTPEQAQLFYRRLLERVQTLPGAHAAGLSLGAPFTASGYNQDVYPEGKSPEGGRVNLRYSVFTPNYFETIGATLLLGRQFSERDIAGAPDVAIINETAARLLWPNENPLGKRLVFLGGEAGGRRMEVVGVARDVKFSALEEIHAAIYMPVAQFYLGQEMALHVRTIGRPETLAAAIEREVSALDRNLPVYDVRTLAARLDNSLTPQRLAALFISGFGLLALILASIGLYSVMAYSVAQRTQEIGIRIALGALARDVIILVIGQGMKLALIGMVIGLGIAWAFTRWVKSLLFGVSATDPLTFALIAILLTAVTLLACWIPARRATKVDPLIALKCD